MKAKTVNRCLAALLSAVMIFTSADFSVFAAGAVDKENNLWTATAAQLVTEHYDFSDTARAVAENAAISSGTAFSSELPKSDLVSVDAETKTVSAEDYIYTGSSDDVYNWKPVNAAVVPAGGEAGEPFSLNRNAQDDGAEASYVTDATNYSVQVTYDLDVAVAAEEQTGLFNVLTSLADGVADLEDLAALVTDVNSTKGEIEGVKDALKAALPTEDTDGLPIAENMAFWVYWDENIDEAYGTALTEMAEYLTSVGTYSSNDCVNFMLGENYPALQTSVSELYAAVKALYDAFAEVEEKVADSTDIMTDYCDMLGALAEKFEPYADAESWAEVTSDDLVAESITPEWQAAVLALAEEGFTAPAEVAGELHAYSCPVSCEVDLCKVSVTVTASIASKEIELGEDAEGALSTVEAGTVLYLPVGTEDIQERIDAAVEELIAGDTLGVYGLRDTDRYICSASEDNIVPDRVEKDTDDFGYLVNCVPVKHAVTMKPVVQLLSAGDTVIDYYYGTSLKLPEAGAEASYDYVVEKAGSELYYNQGESVVVDEPMTLTCYEGAAKEEYTYTSLLAQDEQYELSEEAAAMLSSNALESGSTAFRVPSDAVVYSIEGSSVDGYSVTMEASYRSGLDNVYWEPYQVTVMGGEDGTQVLATVEPSLDAESGKYVASWNTEEKVTHVVATYRLKVKEDEQVAAWLKLPSELAAEVQSQDKLVETAEKLYEKLAEQPILRNKTALRLLSGNLEDQTIITELLKDETAGGCWTDKVPAGMAIYRYLNLCADSEGKISLGQYYRQKNGPAMAEQAARLSSLLERLLADNGLLTALESSDMVDDPQAAIEKMSELIGYLDSLENLKNFGIEGIDTNASGFDALIETAAGAGTVDVYTGSSIYAYHDVQKNSDGIVTLKASVKVGKETKTAEGYNVTVGEDGVYTLTDADKTRIYEMMETLETEWKLAEDEKADGAYYEITTDPIPEEVAKAASVVTIGRTYVPNTYTVKTADESYVRTFTYGGADSSYTIDLVPRYEDAAQEVYYRYTIGDDVRHVANGEALDYTFKKADLAAFGASRTLVISHVETTARKEAMDSFIGGLNDALKDMTDADGNRLAAFVPVEKDGEYNAVIMRLTSSTQMDMTKIMGSVAAAFQNMTYDYVGVDGKDGQTEFIYTITEKDASGQDVDVLKMKPQALIDIFLNGGISTESMLELINADGSVKEFSLPEGCTAETDVIDGAALGGLLAQNNLYLGASKDDCDKLNLYVTIVPGDNTKMFQDMRKTAEDTSKYVTFTLDDGAIQMKGIMPEKAYKVYLSVMVLLGEKDLNDLDSTLRADVDVIEKALENLLDDRDQVDAAAVEETLNRIGMEVSLKEHATVVNRVIKVVLDLLDEDNTDKNPDITVDEDVEKNQFGFVLSYNAESLLGGVAGLELVESMLEGNLTITLPVELTILNYGKEYEALVFDTSKSGIEKLNYVESLADTLANAGGQIYAVLLRDIDSNLTISKSTILNLYGKTISGDITANANLRIVDSTLDPEKEGDVTGRITSADGVEVTDGTVADKYYSVSVDDNEDIVITVNTEFADILDQDYQTFGVQLMSDVLFNIHSSAKAVVNGKELYNIDIDDLLDLVGGGVDFSAIKGELEGSVNTENVNWLIKDLSDRFTLEGMADVLESDDLVLASYEFTEAPWFLNLELIKDGDSDYIGVGVEPGAEETHKLTVKFDKADDTLAAMLRDIAKILTVKKTINVGSVSYVDGQLNWNGELAMDVTLDVESKDSTSSDYVTVLAVIMAHNSDDREAYAADVRLYEENIYDESLKKRFNEMTVKEFADALKAAEDTDFVQMVQDLGIPELLTEAVRLEAVYNSVLEIGYDLIQVIEEETDDGFEKYENRSMGGLYSEEKKCYTASWSHAAASNGSLALTVNMKLFAEAYDSTVEDVMELIDAIPELSEIYDEAAGVDNREKYVGVINAARQAYDKLDADAKKVVSNYADLLNAEALYSDEDVWVTSIDKYTYTGMLIKPEVQVYEGTTLLKENVDYKLSYKNNLNAYNIAGKSEAVLKQKAPAVVVTFIKNYTGTIEQYFTIDRITVSKGNNKAYCDEVGLEIEKEVYKIASSKAAAVKPTIYLNGMKVSASEYTARLYTLEGKQLTSKNELQPGVYNVIIKGEGKNFTGTYGLNGEIKQIVGDKWIYAAYAPVIADKEYTGQPITLTSKELGIKYNGKSLLVDVTTRPGHYSIQYLDNTEIGTATAIITGTGKYITEGATNLSPYAFTGTKIVKFNITGETLGMSNVKIGDFTKIYTGNAIELADTEYTITNAAGEVLVKDVDYTVSYKNNTNAGKASVTFTGKGKYTGTITKNFTIEPVQLEESMLVTAYPFSVAYEKGGVTPYDEIKLSHKDVTLTAGEDYTITWTNNDKVGTASFVVTGKGNFTGSLSSKTFTIEKGILASTIMSAQNVYYVASKKNNFHTTTRLRDRSNGQMLTAGVDYKNVYYYYWNTKIVTGKDEWVKVDSGQSLEAAVEKVLAERYPTWSESYVTKRVNSIKYFEMKVKVYGCGNYHTGSRYVKEALYTVYKKDLSKAKVTGTAETLVYNNKAQKLEGVTLKYGTVELVEGTDYTVKYSENITVGTVTATMTGLGQYGGTKTVTFQITPKPIG